MEKQDRFIRDADDIIMKRARINRGRALRVKNRIAALTHAGAPQLRTLARFDAPGISNRFSAQRVAAIDKQLNARLAVRRTQTVMVRGALIAQQRRMRQRRVDGEMIRVLEYHR